MGHMVLACRTCVTLGVNIAFVPTFGYMACAWAAFCCYGFMMVASYLVGRVKYPIPYEVGRLALYAVAAMAAWLLSFCHDINDMLYTILQLIFV